MKRIFLLSSERSGSNLLRTFFDKTNEIDGPYAPQLLKSFLPYITTADILSSPEKRKRIIHYSLSLITNHPNRWKYIPPIEKFQKFIDESNWEYLDLFDAIYSDHAKHEGKIGYFIKENNVFDFAGAIEQHLDTTFFIHLVRDPRDVYLSFSKVPGGPKHPYLGGIHWKDEQERILSLKSRNQIKKLHTVRYEDLIGDTENVLRECFKFTEIPFNSEILSQKREIDKSDSPFLKNISKGIMKHNTNKYKEELTKDEVHIVETAAGRGLIATFKYKVGCDKKRIITNQEITRFRVVHNIKNIWSYTKLSFKEFMIRFKRAIVYLQIRRLVS
ncbi:sulfotransferase [Candidatus Dojkabacteria bacterium]|uniref:Sulfotransferase n=1 Tax=Candidatus Dojkabacteria bacterium TaxID=2099670 RepID=A0A955RK57_9BACT|nr:sulfotransferase [Candidatus Dojkabacteria bacterium]